MSEFNFVNALKTNGSTAQSAYTNYNTGQSGLLSNGINVRLANGISSLQDQAMRSLEEMSLAGANRSHRRLAQRQRNAQRPKMEQNIKQLKKLQEAAFPIKKLDQIKSCINYLKDNRNDMNFIKQWLGDFSKDKTEQYIALLTLRQELSIESGNEVAVQSVQEAINQLEQMHETKVGFEAFKAIALANEQGFDQDELRDQFQKTLEEFGSMSSALNWLTKTFGTGKLSESSQEIYKQKASQYHMGGSNIDKAQLVSLLREMSMLKTMLGIFDQCLEAAHIVAKELSGTLGDTAYRIFELVLDLQAKNWIEQGDIKAIANTLNLEKMSDLNVLGVQLKKIIGFIPMHSYLNDGQKQQCLDTLATYLDGVARNEHANS